MKTAILSGVFGATVSKVTSAYMNHGKTISVKKRGAVGENQHGWKEIIIH
jgi:hypothetical protein